MNIFNRYELMAEEDAAYIADVSARLEAEGIEYTVISRPDEDLEPNKVIRGYPLGGIQPPRPRTGEPVIYRVYIRKDDKDRAVRLLGLEEQADD